jgi:Effector-associated domain 1
LDGGDREEKQPVTHRLYISFADEDRDFRDALVKHLTVRVQNSEIVVHDVTSVGFVSDARAARLELLDAADVVVLILSANYFASVECFGHDLPRAMARGESWRLPIVPVIVRDFDIQGTPIEGRKVLPDSHRSVGSPQNDKVWTEITRALQVVFSDLVERGSRVAPHGGGVPPSSPSGVAPVAAIDSGDIVEIMLDGKRTRALCEALVDAFPSYDELGRMMRFELGVNLAKISPPGPLEDVALSIVTWAEKQSLVARLLRGAIEQNPRNSMLRELARGWAGGAAFHR